MLALECLTGLGGGGEGKYELRQRTVTMGRRLRVYARSRIRREHTKVVGGEAGLREIVRSAKMEESFPNVTRGGRGTGEKFEEMVGRCDVGTLLHP